MQPQLDLFNLAETPKAAPASKVPKAGEPVEKLPILDLTAPAAVPSPSVAVREEEPSVLTVSQLTRSIRSLIESQVGEVWVEGEVSNLRKQSSGHQYFTLKDSASQLACVLFSGNAAGLRGLKLADGQHVQAFGQVTVYEARGQYQMIVRLVQNRGEGVLQARYEALKRKLEAEGLFASERKRPLPRFPSCVGVVTSPTGAALRDFLNVLHRRHPGISVLISPVRVQGTGAAKEIAQAIREFNEPSRHNLPEVDVIVVTRGGGSIEDLWEFNEEEVARAIAASSIPVLSAIGHEIDFTIADFAADLRAPTPSAAAEILAADRLEVLDWLRQRATRIRHAVKNRLELLTTHIRALAGSSAFREPFRRLEELQQTLDRHDEALARCSETTVERGRNTLHRLTARLDTQSPAGMVEKTRLHSRWLKQKLDEQTRRLLLAWTTRLDRARGVLEALSPQGTLARGYTITLGPEGSPLTRAAQVAAGATLRTRFADGEVESFSAAQLTPPGGKDKKGAS